MVIFWDRKLTEASFTPSSFLMAASILAAQLAQSRSISLKVFFMKKHSFLSSLYFGLPIFFCHPAGVYSMMCSMP